MADNETASEARAAEQSLGDLVALASKDVSTLIRAELALAKMELTADAKRMAIGGGMFTGAGLISHLAVIMLSFALALGLHAAGLWDWLAFLVVGAAYLLFAGLLVLVGTRRMKKITGPKRTMATLKADAKALRHKEEPATAVSEAGAATAAD